MITMGLPRIYRQEAGLLDPAGALVAPFAHAPLSVADGAVRDLFEARSDVTLREAGVSPRHAPFAGECSRPRHERGARGGLRLRHRARRRQDIDTAKANAVLMRHRRRGRGER